MNEQKDWQGQVGGLFDYYTRTVILSGAGFQA
jgi:hypothetical protein